jgi:LysM repeat protein
MLSDRNKKMNIRDLLDKIDTLAEADDARAQYDKFKADDAKSEARAAAIQLVKSRIMSKWQVPTGMSAISKEEGTIMWGDTNGRGGSGDSVTGRTMSMDMYNKGNNFVDAPLKNALAVLGLTVGPVAQKSLFGSREVAGISLQQLADIDKPVDAPVTVPGTAPVVAKPPGEQSTKPAVRTPEDDGHTAKLNALSLRLQDKLNAKKTSKPVDTLPGKSEVDQQIEKDKTNIQNTPPAKDEKVPPNLGNDTQAPDELYTIQKGDNLTKLASKFGTTVPELLKLNPQITNPNLIITGKDLKIPSGKPVADKPEINSNKSPEKVQAFEGVIAKELIESFGYDVELDEYSLNQFGKDVGAGARGVGNGLTFGYGDNMLAGAKAGLGIEKDYKTALGKEMANTARAKANSSSAEFNNPFHDTWLGNKMDVKKTFKVNPYDVGDIVGTVATPIPGGLAGKGLVKSGLINLGTAAGAGIAKNWHDERSTGLTQELVDRLAAMDPAILKDLQRDLKIADTGKLDPATLDAIGKQAKAAKDVKEARESQNKILSESEKMSALKNRLARIDEGSPGAQTIARPIEKLLGISAKDLAKMTDKEIANMIGHGGKLERTPSGIIMPKVEPKIPTKVEPKIPTKAEPVTQPNVKNTNTNTNTANGGTSSSTSAGGNAGVKGSGNSTNTITNNPVININIGAKELAAAERAVAHDAGPILAKEFEAVVKTGDKVKIGGWWARNKNKVKWTSGTLAVLSAVGLAGLLWGGKDDEQDVKPDPDAPPVTPVDPSVTPVTPSVTPVTPVAPNDKQDTKTDAEVEALIKQMQELMLGYENDESPEWSQATSNAQSLIDQAKGGNNAQIGLDKEAARRMPASRDIASTKPAADSEQGPERLGYSDDELQRIMKNAGGYQRSDNTKAPIGVAGGTIIGPKMDRVGDYRLDPEGKAKLKAN